MVHHKKTFAFALASVCLLAACSASFGKIDKAAAKNIISSYLEKPEFINNYIAATGAKIGSKNDTKLLNALKKQFPEIKKLQLEDEDIEALTLTEARIDSLDEGDEIYAEDKSITYVSKNTTDFTIAEGDDAGTPITVEQSYTFDQYGLLTSRALQANVTKDGRSAGWSVLYTCTYSTYFVLTFNSNADDATPAEAQVYNVEQRGLTLNGLIKEGLSINQPIRDGYTFDGWVTSASGSTKYDFDSIIAEDVTLYAHWVKVA